MERHSPGNQDGAGDVAHGKLRKDPRPRNDARDLCKVYEETRPAASHPSIPNSSAKERDNQSKPNQVIFDPHLRMIASLPMSAPKTKKNE